MPHYEFLCHTCKKTFSKILALVDYEEGEIRCPRGGGAMLVGLQRHHREEERLTTHLPPVLHRSHWTLAHEPA